jgi:hypothetical protein
MATRLLTPCQAHPSSFLIRSPKRGAQPTRTLPSRVVPALCVAERRERWPAESGPLDARASSSLIPLDLWAASRDDEADAAGEGSVTRHLMEPDPDVPDWEPPRLRTVLWCVAALLFLVLVLAR